MISGLRRTTAAAGLLVAIAITDAPRYAMAADQVDAVFQQGVSLFEAKDYEGARRAFEAAWKQRQSFDIAGNLGLTELKLERYRDAAEHLDYAVKHFPATETESRRKGLTEHLELARSHVCELQVVIDVDGARLTVDEHDSTPAGGGQSIFVDPGDHVVGANKPGYVATSQSLHAEGGKTQSVSLSLHPGSSGPRPVWIAVGGATTALGIGAGILFTVLSNNKSSDRTAALNTIASTYPKATAANVCGSGTPATTACANVRSLANSQGNFKGGAITAFAIGGAAAIGTVVYVLVSSKAASPPPSTGLGFDLGPKQAGLSVSSSF